MSENFIKKKFLGHQMAEKSEKYKNSEIYICPYCGSEVEVSDGNCWHCPNCGIGECGISEDMVVDENYPCTCKNPKLAVRIIVKEGKKSYEFFCENCGGIIKVSDDVKAIVELFGLPEGGE